MQRTTPSGLCPPTPSLRHSATPLLLGISTAQPRKPFDPIYDLANLVNILFILLFGHISQDVPAFSWFPRLTSGSANAGHAPRVAVRAIHHLHAHVSPCRSACSVHVSHSSLPSPFFACSCPLLPYDPTPPGDAPLTCPGYVLLTFLSLLSSLRFYLRGSVWLAFFVTFFWI